MRSLSIHSARSSCSAGRIWWNAVRSAPVEALLSTAPARLLGLEAGTLKPGSPADIVLVDLDRPWVVEEHKLRSRSKNTAFEGARLQGMVLQTLVAGRTVYSTE